MSPVALAVLPDLALIVLGASLRRALADDVWRGLDKLCFLVLLPALIFTSIAGREINPADLSVVAPAAALIVLAGLALGAAMRPLSGASFLDFSGVWQTAWRFNTALALVAAQALSDAHLALMAIAVGVAIPIANVLAVAALSHGGALRWEATLRAIALNPFFLASAGGLAVALSGVDAPMALSAPLERVAEAAAPVALICVGAALSLRALAAPQAALLGLTAVKLLLLPAATFAMTMGLGAAPVEAATLTVFAALPTSTSSHVLAAAFGADRDPVATLTAQSTALGCLTLPLWLTIVAVYCRP